MLHPPPQIVASWPTPNFVDPQMQPHGRTIATCILTPITTLIVIARVYTRLHLTKSFSWDDVILIVATILTIAFNTIIAYVDTQLHGRCHSWDVPLEETPKALMLFFSGEVLYAIASPLPKYSLLFLYWRLLKSSTHKQLVKAAIFGTAALVSGVGISFLFSVIFQCNPVKSQWDVFPSYPYTCITPKSLLIFGSLNTVDDFLVLLIPIPIIWTLQLHARQRIAVLSLFSISFLACIAGISRTIFSVDYVNSYDQSWASWSLGLASILEINIGLLCASVPALKPLFQKFCPRMAMEMQGKDLGEKNLNARKSIKGLDADLDLDLEGGAGNTNDEPHAR